jgi:hypothetical protein
VPSVAGGHKQASEYAHGFRRRQGVILVMIQS